MCYCQRSLVHMKQLKKGLGMGKSLNDSAKNEYSRDDKKTNFLHSFYIALLEKVEKVSGAINKKLLNIH